MGLPALLRPPPPEKVFLFFCSCIFRSRYRRLARMLSVSCYRFFLIPSLCLLTHAFVGTKWISRNRFSQLGAIEQPGVIPEGYDVVPNEIIPVTSPEKGVVLLAQPDEFNHFLIRASVLLFDYGTERGSRGVILERATAFTMGETSPNAEPFEGNTLFMGGDDGSDTAMMFHRYDLGGMSKYLGSGVYLGGMKEAREMVLSRNAKPRDFKFIFNSVEWAPGLLETEIAQGRWDLVKLPPDLITEQGANVGKLWFKARGVLRSQGALKTMNKIEDDRKREDPNPWDLSGNLSCSYP